MKWVDSHEAYVVGKDVEGGAVARILTQQSPARTLKPTKILIHDDIRSGCFPNTALPKHQPVKTVRFLSEK
jgi:hypothetical protein